MIILVLTNTHRLNPANEYRLFLFASEFGAVPPTVHYVSLFRQKQVLVFFLTSDSLTRLKCLKVVVVYVYAL
jgi:hypothetical protein